MPESALATGAVLIILRDALPFNKTDRRPLRRRPGIIRWSVNLLMALVPLVALAVSVALLIR